MINGPHSVDVHVGAHIRLRRKELKISQDTLAQALGLTFQQVQKYERGTNRVSASKLHEIAATLQTPITSFFEGLPEAFGAAETEEDRAARLGFATYDGRLMMRAWSALGRLDRERLLDLALRLGIVTTPTQAAA